MSSFNFVGTNSDAGSVPVSGGGSVSGGITPRPPQQPKSGSTAATPTPTSGRAGSKPKARSGAHRFTTYERVTPKSTTAASAAAAAAAATASTSHVRTASSIDWTNAVLAREGMLLSQTTRHDQLSTGGTSGTSHSEQHLSHLIDMSKHHSHHRNGSEVSGPTHAPPASLLAATASATTPSSMRRLDTAAPAPPPQLNTASGGRTPKHNTPPSLSRAPPPPGIADIVSSEQLSNEPHNLPTPTEWSRVPIEQRAALAQAATVAARTPRNTEPDDAAAGDGTAPQPQHTRRGSALRFAFSAMTPAASATAATASPLAAAIVSSLGITASKKPVHQPPQPSARERPSEVQTRPPLMHAMSSPPKLRGQHRHQLSNLTPTLDISDAAGGDAFDSRNTPTHYQTSQNDENARAGDATATGSSTGYSSRQRIVERERDADADADDDRTAGDEGESGGGDYDDANEQKTGDDRRRRQRRSTQAESHAHSDDDEPSQPHHTTKPAANARADDRTEQQISANVQNLRRASHRLFPPSLVEEVNSSHLVYAQFRAECDAITRRYAAVTTDPAAVLRAYESLWYSYVHKANNLSLLLSRSADALPPAADDADPYPNTVLTLCVSHLLDAVFRSPALFLPQQSELLTRMLQSVMPSVFHAPFDRRTNIKRTPHAARLKHTSDQRNAIMRDVDAMNHRLSSLVRILRMVVARHDTAFAHVCFRLWRHTTRIAKVRERMYQFSIRAANDAPASGVKTTDARTVFRLWHDAATHQRLKRKLTTDANEWSDAAGRLRLALSLSGSGDAPAAPATAATAASTSSGRPPMLDRIKSSASAKAAAPPAGGGVAGRINYDALQHDASAIEHSLLAIEKIRTRTPLRPNPYIAPAMIDLLFARCSRELEIIRNIPASGAWGCVPLFRLSPQYTGDVSKQLDEAIRRLPELGERGVLLRDGEQAMSIINSLTRQEGKIEDSCFSELSELDPEDFCIAWFNYWLSPAASTASPRATATNAASTKAAAKSNEPQQPQSQQRRLRDFATDLRDSELYLQLLHAIARELPISNGDQLIDLHSRARFVLEICARLGARRGATTSAAAAPAPASDGASAAAAPQPSGEDWMKSSQFTDGEADLHVLLVCSLFLARHGFATEPEVGWSYDKTNQLQTLRDQWTALSNAITITAVAANTFLALLHQLSVELSVYRVRILRRSKHVLAIRAGIHNFMERVYRVRAQDDSTYHPKHVKHQFQTPLDDASIERLTTGSALQRREDVHKVRALFGRHRHELKKIVRHYARNSTNQCIDFTHFIHFANDVGFTKGSNAIPHPWLRVIFRLSSLTPEERKELFAFGADIEPHPHDSDERMFGQLNASQFMDAIIRCADRRHRTSTASASRLSDRVRHALQSEVLVGAVRTSVDVFRRALSRAPVQAVLTMHKPRLIFIFRHYAALDTTTGAIPIPAHVRSQSTATAATAAAAAVGITPSPLEHLSTINIREFLTLAEDAQLVVPPLSVKQLQRIFVSVQQDDEFGDDAVDSRWELSYVEFVEALATAAVYCMPDPFTPLSQKLELFLEKRLFGPLSSILPALRLSSSKQ